MAALKRARRRDVKDKAMAIQAVLRGEYLRRPGPVTTAYAAVVRSPVAAIATLNIEIKNLEEQVKECFGQARDAEIYLSQPGAGQIVSARVLGEFGDDETRYASAKNRKNYVGTSPVTKQSGKKKVV
jgi:transposase